MAAKEVKTWDVAFAGCNSRHEAQMLIWHVGPRFIGTVTKHIAFVCPHCGKPWPIINYSGMPGMYEGVMPMHKYRKFASDPTYTKLDYCCNATREECEASDG